MQILLVHCCCGSKIIFDVNIGKKQFIQFRKITLCLEELWSLVHTPHGSGRLYWKTVGRELFICPKVCFIFIQNIYRILIYQSWHAIPMDGLYNWKSLNVYMIFLISIFEKHNYFIHHGNLQDLFLSMHINSEVLLNDQFFHCFRTLWQNYCHYHSRDQGLCVSCRALGQYLQSLCGSLLLPMPV